ncbi:hypothetical protein MTO96_016393 [Rhipicephalus appendiculatus]
MSTMDEQGMNEKNRAICFLQQRPINVFSRAFEKQNTYFETAILAWCGTRKHTHVLPTEFNVPGVVSASSKEARCVCSRASPQYRSARRRSVCAAVIRKGATTPPTRHCGRFDSRRHLFASRERGSTTAVLST